jgi:hypothetical protein
MKMPGSERVFYVKSLQLLIRKLGPAWLAHLNHVI